MEHSIKLLPLIKPGQRAVIAGRTGSGKTTVAAWHLNRTPQHWVILNPKHTAGYKDLPDSNVLNRFNSGKLEKSIKEHRFTVINFPGDQANMDVMDFAIEHLHGKYENIGLCVDELYTIHNQARCGDGLTGWLTRGRERKQSFLGLTQRPAWISKFVFSETDYIASMDLLIEDDRKKMYEYTGRKEYRDRLTKRYWRWYNVDEDSAQLWGAVPLLTNPSEEKTNG